MPIFLATLGPVAEAGALPGPPFRVRRVRVLDRFAQLDQPCRLESGWKVELIPAVTDRGFHRDRPALPVTAGCSADISHTFVQAGADVDAYSYARRRTERSVPFFKKPLRSFYVDPSPAGFESISDPRVE